VKSINIIFDIITFNRFIAAKYKSESPGRALFNYCLNAIRRR
jgi:hypothetical protein